MVVPVLIAVAGSVAVGYITDNIIGDGNYTAREATVDTVTGMLGLGLLKSGAKVIGGVRHAHKAKHLDDAGEVAIQSKVGFAVAREGVIEIQVIRGLDRAINPPSQNRTAKVSGVSGGIPPVAGPPRVPRPLRSLAVTPGGSVYIKAIYRRKEHDKRRKYF